MKKLLLLFILSFSFSSLFAQTKVAMTPKEAQKHMKEVQKSKDKGTSIWDWDTVYNNGIPYCIIYEVEKGAFHHNDYSIRSITGQELIYVQYGSYTDYNAPHAPNTSPPTYGYYLYIFSDTKNVAEASMNRPFKEVVRNNLIDNGTTINSAAEAKFVAACPRRYSAMTQQPIPQPAPATGGVNYTIVERNHSGGILIIGTDINQDGKSIGSIQSTEVATNGTIMKTINVFLPNGTKIAVATCQGSTAHNWNIITLKNNMQGSVNSSNGQDNMDIAKYLINGYYL